MCNFFQNGVFRFGEIIAAFTLGLELSTLSAIAGGQFATAHERLGRNHPTHGLKDEHLNEFFFRDVLGDIGTFVSVTPFAVSDCYLLQVCVLYSHLPF